MADDGDNQIAPGAQRPPEEFGQTPPSPPARKFNSTMKRRTVLGSTMILALIGLFVLDWWLGRRHWPAEKGAWEVFWSTPGAMLCVLVLALTVVAFAEAARLAKAAGAAVLGVSGLVGAVLLAGLPLLKDFLPYSDYGANGPLLCLGLLLILAFAEQMARSRTQAAFARLGVTMLVVLYLGVGGAMTLALRMRWGVGALVMFLAAVKFTDIGAYFAGSFWGRHKIIPWLSPGKSWQGLLGGILAAVAISALARLILRVEMSYLSAAVFGAVMALAGQFADLAESLLKRTAGVKDSGAVLPDFGGVLDIVDSVLLSSPVAYLAMTIAMRQPTV